MHSASKCNIFKNIPKVMPEEVFQTIFESQNIKIERIISMGHKSEDDFWYDQNQSEWIMILQGKAQLEFEGGVIELTKGDYLNIEAHKKHRVKWTPPEEETIWLAIFY